MKLKLKLESVLPQDKESATLVGRAWLPGKPGGPSPVALREGSLYDLSAVAATSSALLNCADPVRVVRDAIARSWAKPAADAAAAIENSHADRRDPTRSYLLAPCDLQAVRACGVTFVSSMVERVIEEHARGDADKAESIRRAIGEEIGAGIRSVKPGSPQALRLKESLIKRDLWSQYLEVGIGTDAEVFNKAQPMSAVGVGAEIGVRSDSSWNNPEPEVGKAKDNNASCSIGPFIRLFDENYSIADMRRTRIEVGVMGRDGFRLSGVSELSAISRDPLDLVGQALNRNHQYPDGMMLFLGTQFAPIKDRAEKGKGFTHQVGDIVSISARQLGTLVNRVNHSDKVTPWTFGVTDLMQNLAQRGLLG